MRRWSIDVEAVPIWTTVAMTSAFVLAFLVVYLIVFFNLETTQALTQWSKGMIKFLLHFMFLVCGLALLARRRLAVLRLGADQRG